ncbi:efflux RND transporter periplasmic adaptor subunit [Candidatus Auribacterota bacterium]
MTTQQRFPVYIVFLIIIILLAFFSFRSCGKSKYKAPPPPEVTVSKPEQKDITEYIEFTGNTAAINTVKLRARVEGYLEKVFFKDGDAAKKDQPLFLIQQNTYEAKLKAAEAEILAQKADLEHAQTEYDRYSGLVKKAAASQTDVDKWHYQRDAAAAAVMQAEANRDLAKLDLGYTTVNAPFDGRIGRRLKDPGNLVGSGEETVLAEFNEIDPIYAYFTISERELLRIRNRHLQFKKTAPEDWKPTVFLGLANEEGYPHKGSLDYEAITVDPTTGTLMLRGIFENSDSAIIPGLFARIRAEVKKDVEAVLIPQTAIGYDQLGTYVYIVNDKNIVERRGIKTGQQKETMQVVTKGLKGQEWVIVNGLLRAIPGRKVTPVNAADGKPLDTKPGASKK